MKGIVAKDRLLRLPLTYANAINDPRTNALTLLSSLRAFDIVFVLTAGGPARATETVGFFMYRESMTQFNLGYGAAATVVLLIAVLVVSTPAIAQRTKGAK